MHQDNDDSDLLLLAGHSYRRWMSEQKMSAVSCSDVGQFHLTFQFPFFEWRIVVSSWTCSLIDRTRGDCREATGKPFLAQSGLQLMRNAILVVRYSDRATVESMIHVFSSLMLTFVPPSFFFLHETTIWAADANLSDDFRDYGHLLEL